MPNVSLRERRRREFLDEIGAVTRELVVDEGPEAVTMAAVADRLGVTAPALYRYVDGRNGLLDLACAAVARELTEHLRGSMGGLGPDPLDRVLGFWRELRRWSLAHRAEFALVFAHPLTWPDVLDASDADEADADGAAANAAERVREAGRELIWLFEATMLELWESAPFPVRDDAELSPELRRDLTTFMRALSEAGSKAGVVVDEAIPLGAVAIGMDFWVRAYGLISMEVFGQLATHSVRDAGPLLEYVLAEFAEAVTDGRRRSADAPEPG